MITLIDSKVWTISNLDFRVEINFLQKVDIKCAFVFFNPLSARIFTVFGQSLLEDRVIHKEAWVAALLGTHLSVQVHKKVKFLWRDSSSLAIKGSKNRYFCALLRRRKFYEYTPRNVRQINALRGISLL